jgi:hypothetical protein
MTGFFEAAGMKKGVFSGRVRLFAIGAVAGAAMIVLAILFLGFSAYLALARILEPWLASLLVALGALILGAILLAIAFSAFSRAANQVQSAVKTNALTNAAPFAAGLALRNPRLLAAAAAALGALIAVLRAFKPKQKAGA